MKKTCLLIFVLCFFTKCATTAPSIVDPTPMYSPAAKYTETARLARTSGIVQIEVMVDATGKVAEATILKTLPYGLGESALTTARYWTFSPGTKAGKPIAVWMLITFEFNIEKSTVESVYETLYR